MGAKALLLVVSLLLAVSMGGGFLLLPCLIPLHIWAARRSGPFRRALWSLFPMAAAGMVTWAALYLAIGEVKPWIWLVPVVATAGAAYAMVSVTRPTPAGAAIAAHA